MSRSTSVSSFKDQAAGLREWAGQQTGGDVGAEGAPAPSRQAMGTLMVVGLPGHDVSRVSRVLDEWREQGQAWVGEPGRWRVVALDSDSPYLATLATQQSRWVLWVESGPDAFRHAYRILKRLREGQGPSCLLLMYDDIGSTRGMLDNLRAAAADFLGMRLIVLEHSRGEDAANVP